MSFLKYGVHGRVGWDFARREAKPFDVVVDLLVAQVRDPRVIALAPSEILKCLQSDATTLCRSSVATCYTTSLLTRR